MSNDTHILTQLERNQTQIDNLHSVVNTLDKRYSNLDLIVKHYSKNMDEIHDTLRCALDEIKSINEQLRPIKRSADERVGIKKFLIKNVLPIVIGAVITGNLLYFSPSPLQKKQLEEYKKKEGRHIYLEAETPLLRL